MAEREVVVVTGASGGVGRSVAREFARRGVRVCSVAPGSVLHPGGSWEKRLQADPQAIAAFVQREIPFGRFGTAAEVGEAICFLASFQAYSSTTSRAMQ